MANSLFVIFKDGAKNDEFTVEQNCSYPVFDVDRDKSKFLLANQSGEFFWVDMAELRLKRRDKREEQPRRHFRQQHNPNPYQGRSDRNFKSDKNFNF